MYIYCFVATTGQYIYHMVTKQPLVGKGCVTLCRSNFDNTPTPLFFVELRSKKGGISSNQCGTSIITFSTVVVHDLHLYFIQKSGVSGSLAV